MDIHFLSDFHRHIIDLVSSVPFNLLLSCTPQKREITNKIFGKENIFTVVPKYAYFLSYIEPTIRFIFFLKMKYILYFFHMII